MFRAWLVWLISALFMCYKNAIEVSPSVMTRNLMEEFSLTGVQMGNFAAFYFYAYLLLQIPAGLLLDKWGPRRVTTVAIGVCSIGIFLFAIADTFWVACTGRFLAGCGAAFAAVTSIKLIANWFPTRRFAVMVGLMMKIGMLGAVIGQAPLSAFISWIGWRVAMAFLGLFGFLLMFLFFFCIRDRAPERKEAMDVVPSVTEGLGTIIRNPQSWYLSIYSGFAFASITAFGGLWGVAYLSQAFGYSHSQAALGTSLVFLGFATGAPLMGWVSDRLRKRKPLMFWGTLIGLISLVFILYFPTGALVMPALFIFGFSISSFILCFSMIKEQHGIIIAGTSFGFMNAFDALFGAFSDPLTGKFLDMTWSGEMLNGIRVFSVANYQIALFLLVGYLVLALAFLKPIRETHCKQV